MDKQPKDKNLRKERIKANILRWWFVGAAYFFIGFGTNVGATSSPIDLIFFLGVGIGLGNIFIFHPIMHSMFTIQRRGKVINQRYFNRTVIQNVLASLGEVARCLVLVILVYLIYQIGNTFLVAITGAVEGTVIVPGEPILFSVFFVSLYVLSEGVQDTILNAIDSSKE